MPENTLLIKFPDATCGVCPFIEHSEVTMPNGESLLCSGNGDIVGLCVHGNCREHIFYTRRPTCPLKRLVIKAGQEISKAISEKQCPSKYHEGDKG